METSAVAIMIDTIMNTFMVTLALVFIVLVIVLIVSVITMEREVKIDESIRKRGPRCLRYEDDETEKDVQERGDEEP